MNKRFIARCGILALAVTSLAACGGGNGVAGTDANASPPLGAGEIETVAGNGTNGYSGDGGQSTSAELYWPYGVALDGGGNIYIDDMENNVIRKVDGRTGIITTVAGTGTHGYGGDNGAATTALLNTPEAVTLDVAGNLYFADVANNRVRLVVGNGN